MEMEMDLGFKKMLFLSGLFHAGMLVILLALALSRSTHPFDAHVYRVDLVTLPPPSPAPVKEVPAAPPPPVQKPPAARPKVEVKKPPIQPPPKAIKPAAKVPPPAKPKPAPAPKEAATETPSQVEPGAKSADNVSAIAPATKLQTAIDVPDFKFPYYTENIRRKIDMNWSAPPIESAADIKEAVVSFVLFPNGKIGDPRIEKSSGNSYFDQAALRAVYLANPFPPFPQGFRDPSLLIHYRFSLDKKS